VNRHQAAEAIEIIRDNNEFVSFSMVREHILENGIRVHSFLEFIHEFLMSFLASVSLNSFVKIVHLNVT